MENFSYLDRLDLFPLERRWMRGPLRRIMKGMGKMKGKDIHSVDRRKLSPLQRCLTPENMVLCK